MNNWRKILQDAGHEPVIPFIERVEEVGTATMAQMRQWFDAHYPEDGSTPTQLDNTFALYLGIMEQLQVGQVCGEYLGSPLVTVVWNKE